MKITAKRKQAKENSLPVRPIGDKSKDLRIIKSIVTNIYKPGFRF